MTRLLLLLLLPLFVSFSAQPAFSSPAFEELLGRNAKLIQKSSSKTVDPLLAEIQDFGGKLAAEFMQNWKDKTLYYIKADGRFVIAEPAGKDDAGKKLVSVIDAVSKQPLGLMLARTVKQIKPNSGVRAKIAGALVPVQLASDNIEVRYEGLQALSRDIQPAHLRHPERGVEIVHPVIEAELVMKVIKRMGFFGGCRKGTCCFSQTGIIGNQASAPTGGDQFVAIKADDTGIAMQAGMGTAAETAKGLCGIFHHHQVMLPGN